MNAALIDLENIVVTHFRIATDRPYRGQRLAPPKNARLRMRAANDNGPKATVIQADCIQAMLEMDAASVSLVVTSPPYPNHNMPYGDRASLAEFIDFSRQWIDHAARVLKPGGGMWINVGCLRADKWTRRIPLTYLLFPICQAVGLEFVQEIVWNPPSRQASCKSRFSIKSERWMYLVKPGADHVFNWRDVTDAPKPGDHRNNKEYSLPVDVWTFNKVNGNAHERTAHPCPFPVAMIERIVLACSNSGDIVLDPFGGSGTTGVAALRHGRSAILIEQSAEYCEIAKERVASAA